jgi:uncharacterized membrane protein YphA (DoxX/SURF4 family)
MSTLAENFNLANEFNILRIICGLFFIPHMIGKYSEREFTMGFFKNAGLNPPGAFINIALAFEALIAIGLIFGIYTSYAAWLAVVFLAVAAVATYRVSGGKWFWNLGGFEYPVFWMICCIVVALHG